MTGALDGCLRPSLRVLALAAAGGSVLPTGYKEGARTTLDVDKVAEVAMAARGERIFRRRARGDARWRGGCYPFCGEATRDGDGDGADARAHGGAAFCVENRRLGRAVGPT